MDVHFIDRVWECVKKAWIVPGTSAVVILNSSYCNLVHTVQLKKVLMKYPHKHTHETHVTYILRRVVEVVEHVL